MKKISRRDFIRVSGLAAGGVTLGSTMPNLWQSAPASKNEYATNGNEQTYTMICPAAGCHQECCIVAHVRDGKVVRTSAPDFPGIPEFNHICVKGLASWQLPYLPNRLNYPMKRVGERGSGNWERISWDEALDMIADKMMDYRDSLGPESVMMWYGGSSSVPVGGLNASIATHRFMNLFGCSVQVGWPNDGAPFVASDIQYGFPFGGLNDPRDWKNSRLMLNWGSNPAETAPRDMKLIMEAKDSGMKLVQISVNYDSTAAKADDWIGVEPGSDGALAMSMINVILREGLHNIPYLIYSTVGPLLVRRDTGKFLRGPDLAPDLDPALYIVFDTASNGPAPMPPHTHELPGIEPALDFEFELNGVPVVSAFRMLMEEAEKYPPELAAQITGVPAERIEQLAIEYATTKPAVIKMGTGYSRYFHGDLTTRAMMTLGAVTGNVGIKGGGAGHWNGEFNPMTNGDAVAAPTDSRSNRIHISEGYRGVTEGSIKALLVFGCNPIHGTPNHRVWHEKILPNLDFLVTSDIVESETARYSDLILPGTSIFERKDIKTKLGYAFLCQKPIEPLFERKSDLEICAGLAQRLGFGEYFEDSTEDYLRQMLDHPTLEGVTLERLENEGGIVFGNGPMEPQIGFANQDYYTPSGRIEFYSELLSQVGEGLPGYKPSIESAGSETSQQFPIRFLTGRRRYWVHTMSYYPRTKELNPEPRLKINPQDAQRRGLSTGDAARVYNNRGEVVIKVDLHPGIRPGVAWIEHGYKPRDFISGFYQDLMWPMNLPTEEMINPAWMLYWEKWKDYAVQGPTPGMDCYGLADQLFDVLCEYEKYIPS